MRINQEHRLSFGTETEPRQARQSRAWRPVAAQAAPTRAPAHSAPAKPDRAILARRDFGRSHNLEEEGWATAGDNCSTAWECSGAAAATGSAEAKCAVASTTATVSRKALSGASDVSIASRINGENIQRQVRHLYETLHSPNQPSSIVATSSSRRIRAYIFIALSRL